MRSPRELIFRLRQEVWNGCRVLHPPRFAGCDAQTPLSRLPDPVAVAGRLRHTAFAGNVIDLAEELMEHRFRLLGYQITAGPRIQWRRDYIHGTCTGTGYFRGIRYLDFKSVGDHKVVWELNRHQHLVALAQAYLFTGRPEFLGEIEQQLNTWWEDNPFLSGINWTSALEVSFRTLSWIWVWHLAGAQMTSQFRRRFLGSLHQHGCYLENNLSVYFSPNTHLLGEAVALHALGALFPEFSRSAHWEAQGARIVDQQMQSQVRDDGSHFEQSTWYHVYALDMFLFHHVLARTSSVFQTKLIAMGEYLSALLSPRGLLPALGDEDGGCFFHPYGDRERRARATLATLAALFPDAASPAALEDQHEQAAWWTEDCARQTRPGRSANAASRYFPGSGIAVMRAQDLHVVVDAGAFGPGSAGHSHSDSLAMVAYHGDEEILIDPGTYTYVSDAIWRNRFRGSAAHNTVCIDGCDQALPAGPFRWTDLPEVRVDEWQSTAAHDYLRAHCKTSNATHRRQILFLKQHMAAVILDEVEGPAGEHLIEQFWHPGAAAVAVSASAFRIGSRTLLVLPSEAQCELTEGGEYGWRSPVFGVKSKSPVIRVFRRSALPVRMVAVLDFSGLGTNASFSMDAGTTCTYTTRGGGFTVQFSPDGFEVQPLCEIRI